MTERGTVKRIKNDIAFVELKKTQKCEGCKLCAFGKDNVIVAPALLDAEVCPGDEVAVRMPECDSGLAPLALFALPLGGLLMGALLGLLGEWWLQLTLSAVGLALGTLAIFPVERAFRRRKGALPVVIGRANEQTQDPETIGEQ